MAGKVVAVVVGIVLFMFAANQNGIIRQIIDNTNNSP